MSFPLPVAEGYRTEPVAHHQGCEHQRTHISLAQTAYPQADSFHYEEVPRGKIYAEGRQGLDIPAIALGVPETLPRYRQGGRKQTFMKHMIPSRKQVVIFDKGLREQG